jgi:hypothetical protein
VVDFHPKRTLGCSMSGVWRKVKWVSVSVTLSESGTGWSTSALSAMLLLSMCVFVQQRKVVSGYIPAQGSFHCTLTPPICA